MIRFRAVQPEDYGWLYMLANDPTAASTWRLRGVTLSPEEFARFLWTGVVTQYVAVPPDDGPPIGLCSAYDHNAPGRTAYVSLLAVPEARGSAMAGAMAVGFVEILFRELALRKVYFLTSLSSYPALHSLEGRFASVKQEAHFHESLPARGGFEDTFVFAVSAEAFESERERGSSLPLLDLMAGGVRTSTSWSEFVAEINGFEIGPTIDPSAPGGLHLVDDLGWDSLALVELVVKLEHNYQRRIDVGTEVTLQALFSECSSESI